MSVRGRILSVAGLTIAALALIQIVPYGRNHGAPPEGTQVAWDSPPTQVLARRACFDCHSNETRWPWYASIAPASWRIQHHVDEGRRALNLSALSVATEDDLHAIREAGETVSEGEMPPRDYLLMHPDARLTPAERRALADGLDRSLASLVAGNSGTGAGEDEAGGR